MVLIAPAALLLAALLARIDTSARALRASRMVGAAAGLGILVAAVAGVWVASAGTQVSPLLGARGLGVSVRLDPLSVTILAMVALLGLVVVRFSKTYLDGDPRHRVFLARLAATIASVELLVVSGNLLVFFAAWVATSLSLHQLLVFYPERPRAQIAARKKFIVARIGDLSLVGAFALLYAHFGTADLGAVARSAAASESSGLLEGATALIALAALLKSAQFPTHGWLVEVMETPTPVSALLHAGILNAGPFLVIRFAPVMELGTTSAAVLVVAGGFTAAFASTVLLTQPSVKVALGYSSAAHMGFMLLVCGLGVYPAAVLHLVAHSFYKAHAFLSSGSVVESARASKVRLASRLRSGPRLLASVALALSVYLATAYALDLLPGDNLALLAVGAIVVMGLSQLLAPSVDSRVSASALLRTAGLALVVALAFFGLEEGTRLLLADALPPLSAPTPIVATLAALVLGVFATVIALQVTGWGARSRWARAVYVHLRNGLYANALFDRWVGASRV